MQAFISTRGPSQAFALDQRGAEKLQMPNLFIIVLQIRVKIITKESVKSNSVKNYQNITWDTSNKWINTFCDYESEIIIGDGLLMTLQFATTYTIK